MFFFSTFVGGSQFHLSTLSLNETNYDLNKLFISSNNNCITKEVKIKNDNLINQINDNNANNINNIIIDSNNKSKSEPNLISTKHSHQKRRFKSLISTLTNYDKEKDDNTINFNKNIKQTNFVSNKKLYKTENNIVDTNFLSPLEKLIDVDYIDKFLNSSEFRERLVNAYSEVTYDDKSTASNYNNLINNNESNNKTTNTFFENNILGKFLY